MSNQDANAKALQAALSSQSMEDAAQAIAAVLDGEQLRELAERLTQILIDRRGSMRGYSA